MLDHYEIPVGVSGRSLLSLGKLTLKTIVVAWFSAMFKDDRVWPDSDAFVPERWLSEYKGVEADRKAFIPFSAGSRNCIGQQYVSRDRI